MRVKSLVDRDTFIITNCRSEVAGEESNKSRIEVEFDMNVLFVLMSLSSNVIAKYEAIYL